VDQCRGSSAENWGFRFDQKNAPDNHDKVSSGDVIMANATRSEKLDLRLTPEAKRVLNAAAQASRRSASEFVLESALDRAQEALPDRQHFGLDAARWKAFLAALDAPPRPLPQLQRLLTEPSVFEQAPTE
jgi:uncharacterized protein (DUF1778 family)